MSKDTLYCPKCNSSNLYIGRKGFSTTKAIVGKAITGSNFGGVLLGSVGANDLQITCLSCGHVFKPNEATGHKLPSEAEIREFEKHVIKPENMIQERSAHYLCDCGRFIILPKSRPYCPSCGRWLSERHLEAGKQRWKEEFEAFERDAKRTRIIIRVVIILLLVGIVALFL